ncbi:MAG: FIST C-terminal domain-containing protein [Acidimicrobiales bacterium]|nr:FIST C-terminal domain-containing protein [Acidimicrobiales bacterium]
MRTTFAHASSEHPLAAQATGEVAGQLLETIGEAPDLLVVFVSPHHVGTFEDIIASLRSLLSPVSTLAASAVAVVAGTREIEDGPAIAAFAGRFGMATPLRLTRDHDTGSLLSGLPADLTTGTVVLLPDPFSFPTDGFLDQLRSERPGLAVAGGLASAARGPGGNRLGLDGDVFTDGAVGVWLPADIQTTTVVSQGCRPVGDPFIVTRSTRNRIDELGGRAALGRLQDMIAALDEDDRSLLGQGLHIGLVIDENQLDFGRGDFLIRAVLGIDQATGAIVVGDDVPVGTTVQFQLRDAATADEDLRQLMDDRRASGALLFTCNGRGRTMFGSPDHDAEVVSEAIRDRALAGMFCAGEIGPVGGASFLHGFTASVVLFA